MACRRARENGWCRRLSFHRQPPARSCWIAAGVPFVDVCGSGGGGGGRSWYVCQVRQSPTHCRLCFLRRPRGVLCSLCVGRETPELYPALVPHLASPPPPSCPCRPLWPPPPCTTRPLPQIAIILPRVQIDWSEPWRGLTLPIWLAKTTCELVVTVQAVRKLVTEIQELRREGPRAYFGTGGAILLENVASLVHGGSILCVLAARLVLGDVVMENAALALASFCSWFYLAYFCVAFRLTGPFVVIAFEVLHQDIPPFSLVATAFLGAFSSALHILSAKEGLAHFVHSFQACPPSRPCPWPLPPCIIPLAPVEILCTVLWPHDG